MWSCTIHGLHDEVLDELKNNLNLSTAASSNVEHIYYKIDYEKSTKESMSSMNPNHNDLCEHNMKMRENLAILLLQATKVLNRPIHLLQNYNTLATNERYNNYFTDENFPCVIPRH